MIELTVQEHDLRQLARALRAEEDGKELRKDLVRELRQAVTPAADEAKAAVRAMPSRGHAGPSLRSAIARRVSVQVRTSGRSAGVRVRSRKIEVRGFTNAPKRLNRRKGWRHPVFGNANHWVHQASTTPDWFDGPMRRSRPTARKAVEKVLDDTARRIARRT